MIRLIEALFSGLALMEECARMDNYAGYIAVRNRVVEFPVKIFAGLPARNALPAFRHYMEIFNECSDRCDMSFAYREEVDDHYRKENS